MLAGVDKGMMEFQLHARPDAMIDLRSTLESAGHTIPAGYDDLALVMVMISST